MFVNTVGIKSADLKDNFAAFRTTECCLEWSGRFKCSATGFSGCVLGTFTNVI